MRRSLAALWSLALVPASAGASAVRPPVALTATPARVVLAGSGHTTIRVKNPGTKRVVVDIGRAGFALDLRGRPRIVRGGTRSARGWLTVRPSHLAVAPRSTSSFVVSAKLPRGAEPGDHDALALLRTRPLTEGRVAVRLRLGVVVVVRAPGKIVRRLELHALRVAHRGRAAVLEATVANRGNVTESLQGVRAVVAGAKSGRVAAAALAATRELRPGTRGIVTFRYRWTPRGWVTVRVVIPPDGGRSGRQRTYRIRL